MDLTAQAEKFQAAVSDAEISAPARGKVNLLLAFNTPLVLEVLTLLWRAFFAGTNCDAAARIGVLAISSLATHFSE